MISLTTLHYIPIVFNFVRTIIFLAFSAMCIASKSYMSLFPTVFVLRNTKVHIGSLNSSNTIPYIKTFVNKILGLNTIL